MADGLSLPYGIKPVNAVLVDTWAGPYTSVAEANLEIPLSVRKQTRFVNIIDSADENKGKLYWYKDGITDEDLVEFSPGNTNNTETSSKGTSSYVTETTNNQQYIQLDNKEFIESPNV